MPRHTLCLGPWADAAAARPACPPGRAFLLLCTASLPALRLTRPLAFLPFPCPAAARPAGRSIGSVLREAAAATQTQRRTRQQSIASFLASRPAAGTDRDPAAPSASKRMRISFELGSGERHRAAAVAHSSQLEPSPEGQAGAAAAAAAAAQEPSSCQSGQPEGA